MSIYKTFHPCQDEQREADTETNHIAALLDCLNNGNRRKTTQLINCIHRGACRKMEISESGQVNPA